MKLLSILFAGFYSLSAFASGTAPTTYPLCNENANNLPCQFSDREAQSQVEDMYFDNQKGFTKITRSAPGIKKHYTNGFLIENERVIKVAQIDQKGQPMGHTYVTTMRYELLLNDCRGTDACMGMYLWTATGITNSDGYTYDSTYTNVLEPVKYSNFPKATVVVAPVTVPAPAVVPAPAPTN